MKRKVVQHGAKTLTISLPAEWVKRNNVHVGDELDIEDKYSSLEVAGSKKEEKNEISLHIPAISKLLFKRLLSNLYKRGYNAVFLSFPDKEIKDLGKSHVLHYLKKTVGWEILEEKEKVLKIGTVASVNEEEFPQVLRRYFLTTLELGETFASALKKDIMEEMQRVIDLEQKHNSLELFCIRALNKTKDVTKIDYPRYFLLIERLEEVGDEYKYMAEHIMKDKIIKVSKETQELLQQINAYLREIYEFYYMFDIKKVPIITMKREEFERSQASFFSKKPEKELILIHFLCSAFIKIYEASSPIVGIKLGDLEKGQNSEQVHI